MYFDSMNLKVDHNRCVNCGACITACSRKALEWDSRHFPTAAKKGDDLCFHCHHCVMVCPAAAISVDGVDPDNCPALDQYPNPRQLLDLMQGRRSARHYQRKTVTKQDIDTLLNAMRYAPTGVNFRQMRFTVLDTLESMDAFRNAVEHRILDATSRTPVPEEWLRFQNLKPEIEAGHDPVFRTAPHLILVSPKRNAPCADADPFIALSYFELMANAMGIGTCWCGRLMNLLCVMPDLLAGLGIDESYAPGYAMLFGYSELDYQRGDNPPPVDAHRLPPLPD